VVSIGRPVETLLASPEDPEWENLSIEFCGGTHLPRTGDAEGFVIIAEDAVAKGVRRLTALTGSAAHEAHATGEMLKSRLDVLRQGGDDALEEGLASLQQEMQSRVLPVLARAELREGMAALQKRLKSAQREAEKASAGDAVAMAREIADRHAEDAELIVERVDGVDGKALRSAMDVIQKRRPGAALLIGSGGEKAALLASCPKAMVGRGLKAGDWIRHVAPIVGGGGGGRPDMAQAGGKDPSRLDEALAEGRAYAERILASVEA